MNYKEKFWINGLKTVIILFLILFLAKMAFGDNCTINNAQLTNVTNLTGSFSQLYYSDDYNQLIKANVTNGTWGFLYALCNETGENCSYFCANNTCLNKSLTTVIRDLDETPDRVLLMGTHATATTSLCSIASCSRIDEYCYLKNFTAFNCLEMTKFNSSNFVFVYMALGAGGNYFLRSCNFDLRKDCQDLIYQSAQYTYIESVPGGGFIAIRVNPGTLSANFTIYDNKGIATVKLNMSFNSSIKGILDFVTDGTYMYVFVYYDKPSITSHFFSIDKINYTGASIARINISASVGESELPRGNIRLSNNDTLVTSSWSMLGTGNAQVETTDINLSKLYDMHTIPAGITSPYPSGSIYADIFWNFSGIGIADGPDKLFAQRTLFNYTTNYTCYAPEPLNCSDPVNINTSSCINCSLDLYVNTTYCVDCGLPFYYNYIECINCFNDRKDQNETEVDYGGECGSCGVEFTKSSDVQWQIYRAIYSYQEFKSDYCDEASGVEFMFVFILLLISALLFFILLLLLMMLIWPMIGILWRFRKRKRKELDDDDNRKRLGREIAKQALRGYITGKLKK